MYLLCIVTTTINTRLNNPSSTVAKCGRVFFKTNIMKPEELKKLKAEYQSILDRIGEIPIFMNKEFDKLLQRLAEIERHV